MSVRSFGSGPAASMSLNVSGPFHSPEPAIPSSSLGRESPAVGFLEPDSPIHSVISGLTSTRQRSTQENAVKAIFDSACSSVVDIIGTLQLELTQVNALARARQDKLESLGKTVGQLENTIIEQNRQSHSDKEDIAELKVEFTQLQQTSSRKILDLQSQLESQRTEHETTVQEMEMEHSDAMAKATAHWEKTFDSLKQKSEDDLAALLAQKEAEKAELKAKADAKLAEIEAFWEKKLQSVTEQLQNEKKAECDRWEEVLRETEEEHAQRLASIEQIWSERYAQVRQRAEKAMSDLKAFKAKNQERQRSDMELLEARGKETAQLMEQAMRLIKQAQDDNSYGNGRFRYIGPAPWEEGFESASVLSCDKENELPSPTAIRTSYVAPLHKGLTPRLRSGSLNSTAHRQSIPPPLTAVPPQ